MTVEFFRFSRTAALLVLCCFFALVPSTAMAAGPDERDSVGISISPVDEQGSETDRTRYSYQMEPGQTVEDKVRVTNVGTLPLDLTVFATDAFNDDEGNYALLETGRPPEDAGSWVTFSGSPQVELSLKPTESVVVPFTVTVPANATPGDHPAGVVAAAAPSGGDLAVERRIANRMYVRVAGAIQPSLTISSFSASHSGGWNPFDGHITTRATITNNGNVALGGRMLLEGTTWFGTGVGVGVDEQIMELLPGNTRTITVELDEVAQVGFAQLNWTLASSIEGDALRPDTALPVVERDAFVLALPWIAVVPLMLIAGAAVFFRWRRGVDARRAAEWMAYTEAEAARKALEARGDSANDAQRELVESGGSRQ